MGSVMTCKENPCCGDMLNCRLPDPFPPESRKPALEAALSASPAAQTEDWVLVPREPTEAMLDAGLDVCRTANQAQRNSIYRAMLATAPSAPQPTEPVAWRCDGCGWLAKDAAADLKALRDAGHVSCCPERKMLPLYLASPVAQQRDEGWQDIATAPKNRKVLAAYRNPLGNWRIVTACYHTELPWSDDHNPEPDDGEFAPEGWYEESDSAETIYRTYCPPTHWRPLPQPPALSPERKDKSNG